MTFCEIISQKLSDLDKNSSTFSMIEKLIKHKTLILTLWKNKSRLSAIITLKSSNFDKKIIQQACNTELFKPLFLKKSNLRLSAIT